MTQAMLFDNQPDTVSGDERVEVVTAVQAAPVAAPGIPARCPVVGKPVCYRGDCRHWSGGGCGHADLTAKKNRSGG